MVLVISERSLEDDTKKSHMGETAVATKGGELSLSPRNLDLTEFAYPSNREVVSFDNASINVDSSSEVFFGPVTQLNVNGNVTIVQNGNGDDADEDNNSEKKQADSAYSSADVPKPAAGVHCFTTFLVCLNLHWIIIRNCLIAGTIIFIVMVITIVVLKKSEFQNEIYDTTFQDPYYNSTLGNHSVIYRKQWGGMPPVSTPVRLEHPINLLIVSCSLKKICNTSETCSSAVKNLQKNHQSVQHFTDIGYNFMIGGDGNIYVGTGWDYKNFHRKTSIGIDFLGHYVYDELTEDMIDAFQKLVEQGLELNKLSKNYKLVGENQTNSRLLLSPGPNIVKLMQYWPHFYNNTWF